jgi:hypothetical protein
MPYMTRLGELATLQTAQQGAADGASLDLSSASQALIEISGSFSGITANFEASLDGSIWFAVVVKKLDTLTDVTTSTSTGFFRLIDNYGLSALRVRTSGSTGAAGLTARARGWMG